MSGVGLRGPRGAPTAVQKSAEGVVGVTRADIRNLGEGPNGPRKGLNGVATRTRTTHERPSG